MSDFDLIIIGTGVSGQAAADEAIGAGLRTAMVERREFGGTCVLRGCEPKKLLFGAAEAVRRTELLASEGAARPAELDWGGLVEFKRRLTSPVPASSETSYSERGVTILHGTASFADSEHLVVDGVSYSADWFVVATGARPRTLGIVGQEHVIDSERFMELDDLPGRIVFIGGGFISFEFAAIARAAGSHVTILHRGHRPLERFDADLTAMLIAEYADRGIEVRVDAAVASVAKTGHGLAVSTEDGRTIECDLAVHGAGRVPDLADLALETANVEYGPDGVHVDDHMRSTTNQHVFAAGDAAALGVQLTPVGMAQGRVAVQNMVAPGSASYAPAVTPSVVYSFPPLAGAGMSADDAAAAGAEVTLTDTSGWWSGKRTGLRHSGAKTIVERGSGRILGAHLLGLHADEVIDLFALMIDRGLTVEDAKRILWTYPTASSEIPYLF